MVKMECAGTNFIIIYMICCVYLVYGRPTSKIIMLNISQNIISFKHQLQTTQSALKFKIYQLNKSDLIFLCFDFKIHLKCKLQKQSKISVAKLEIDVTFCMPIPCVCVVFF